MKATCHGLTLSVVFFPQCCVNKRKICPNQKKKKKKNAFLRGINFQLKNECHRDTIINSIWTAYFSDFLLLFRPSEGKLLCFNTKELFQDSWSKLSKCFPVTTRFARSCVGAGPPRAVWPPDVLLPPSLLSVKSLFSLTEAREHRSWACCGE